MPPPRYRVVFRQEPPFRIRFGADRWRLDYARLARTGAVALVEELRPVKRPTGTYLDCGNNVFVPLGRKRARDLTGAQIQRLCAGDSQSPAPVTTFH